MLKSVLLVGVGIALATVVGLVLNSSRNGSSHGMASSGTTPSASNGYAASASSASREAGRVSDNAPASSNDQDQEDPGDRTAIAQGSQGLTQPSARQNSTGVFINGKELSREQAMGMAQLYHYPPVPGHFWYDTRSGAWGLEGHEAVGFLLPGHDFGQMSPNASNGNTGVFINGREINMVEAARIQQTFGAVYRGRWWLDGRTGYYGIEGNPMPVGNIITALQSQRSGSGGDNFWSSATARGNDDGHSGYVSVDGVTVGYDH